MISDKICNMTYSDVMRYIETGTPDGSEYALEWIATHTKEEDMWKLVQAVFNARKDNNV